MARLLLWSALALGLVVGAWQALARPGVLDTDVLRLVPALRAEPAVEHAIAVTRTRFLQHLDLLIGGDDAAAVRAAAANARVVLAAAHIGRLAADDAGAEAVVGLLEAHPYRLLADADRAALSRGGPTRFAADVEAALASPVAASPLAADRDPAGYLGGWAATLPRALPDWQRGADGALERRIGPTLWVLTRVALDGSPFDAGVQDRSSAALDQARALVTARCADCRVLSTGAVRFAAAARASAQREIAVLSAASTLLISLLVLAIFRSPIPLLVTLATLAVSSAAATLAVVLAFGEVHVLTLVFGTSLLGVAVDYATHYLVEHATHPAQRSQVIAHIIVPLVLGMLTSFTAYCFLALAGLPALQQVAMYSCAGLLTVLLTILTLFPVALRDWTPAPPRPGALLARIAASAVGARARTPLIVLALAGACAAALWMRPEDDLRQLQAPPAELVAEDRAVRDLLGASPLAGFVLVRGADAELVARNEEQVIAAAAAAGGDALAFARLVPSLATQEANLAAWRAALGDLATAEAALRRLGFREGTGAALVTALERAPAEPLQPAAALALPGGDALAALRFEHGGTHYGIVALTGIAPAGAAALASAAADARWVSPLDELAAAFRGVRERALWLTAAAMLAIGALLALRYGPRDALVVLTPPLLALGLTLGVLTLAGVPLNIFVMVALVLVLGIGADHSLFARESRAATARLAMLIAAITTAASFGFLAFSSIPALRGFGLTVFVGVVAAYLLAPLAAAKDSA